MKTKRFLMLGLIVGAFCLTGCDKDTNNDSNQNSPAPLTLLETLKGKAKSIAAKILNKSEETVTFAEFEGEYVEADVYYYDSTSLTFVDIEFYKESFDLNLADNLVSYLPSNALLTFNDDYFDLLDDYGVAWCDRYYSDGVYTYNIYVSAYEEYDDGDTYEPAETYACIYIFKTSQEDAFDNYMSEE